MAIFNYFSYKTRTKFITQLQLYCRVMHIISFDLNSLLLSLVIDGDTAAAVVKVDFNICSLGVVIRLILFSGDTNEAPPTIVKGLIL